MLIKRHIRSVLALALVLLLGQLALAQQQVHTVKKSESVYGISKQYGVSVDQLLEANPGAREGIRVGQQLTIPNAKAAKAEKALPAPNPGKVTTDLYTVKAGDTFFRIAYNHGLTRTELEKLNPDVDIDHIEAGMLLRLRASAPKVEYNQPLPQDKPRVSTMPVDAQPVRNERSDQSPALAHADTVMPQSVANRDLNIVVMLPFMLDQSKPGKQAQMYTDFYRGMLLAAQDNKGAGQRPVKITALDTRGSLTTVNELLNSQAIHDAAVVIAPEDADQLRMVNAAGKANNFYTFNIFNVKDESYQKQPRMMQANITHDLMYDKAIAALKSSARGRTLVILNTETGRKDKQEFVGAVQEAFASAGLPMATVNYSGSLHAAALDSIVATGQHLLFLPVSGSSQEFGRIYPALKKLREDSATPDQYRIFGYPDWSAFRGDRLDELHNINATIYTRFYDDTTSALNQSVQDEFKRWFGQPMMDVAPKQALLGYDVATYLIMALRSNMGDFNKEVRPLNGLQSAFHFAHEQGSKGLSNEALYIVEFMPDKTINRTLY